MSTILVADDNSNIQKMVTLALQELGIHVIAVGNGEAAVRKLADTTPDLVLADVFMPVRNGYEVCEYIKREARYSHIPVVLLIGAFDPLDEKEAHRVGANGILKKPFVPPDPLISMVTGFLAGTEKHKSANEAFPETARTAPPPVAQAAPPAAAKTNPKFAATEIEPEEFAFTRGPLSLRDSAHERDSNEESAVASEPGIEENKIEGSWEDRIKPQPPSPLEQQLEAVESQAEKSAPWDDGAELKPSSTWQPQIPTNATSSWETAAEEWQAESLKDEVKIREDHAPSSTEAPESMVEPEPILTEEITLPGQSITGEASKISVDASPSQELAESPAEWMELMSGAPTISVPPEAAETWDVTPAPPTSGVNAPPLQASPRIESPRVNPPAKDHSVPLVVIPFHSIEEAAPQSSEPVSIEPGMAFRPDEEKNAADPVEDEPFEIAHAQVPAERNEKEIERPSEAFSFGPSPYLPAEDSTELLPTQQTAFEKKGEAEEEPVSIAPDGFETFSESHYAASSIDPEPTPPPADPALVEHIVAKVLERLEPQLHSILSQELVRPLVESLLHPEVEKKGR